MAISDYFSLLIDAGEYAGRNDIANVFPRFVGLAEAKLNRILRVGHMETSGTVVLTDGNGDLPEDFLEARLITTSDGRGLNAWSMGELNRRYASYGGVPAGYAVVGNVIRVRPTTSGSLTLDYYAKIPPLTAANPTNWLLELAPDVYLYALCEEIAIWERDANKVAASKSLKDTAILGLELMDERSRWGNAQVVVSGPTP